MEHTMALLITLLSGLFFLVGFVLVKFLKNKKELAIIATGMAFVVMIGMLLFDLLPEIIESVNGFELNLIWKILIVIFFVTMGILVLKLFDLFLPAHHHEHHEKDKDENLEEHVNHMAHVGFIMAVSLVLHNILEGMTIYLIACENSSSGILMALGVGLHNLPLGIEIASSLNDTSRKKGLKFITMIVLFLSTFLGALIFFFLGNQFSEFLLFIFLTVASGMILYIAIFELLPEVITYKKKKSVYVGMLIGIFFLLMMTFLE